MEKKRQRILALDPSSTETGYACMNNLQGEVMVDNYGSIKATGSHDLGRRLSTIRESVEGLISRNRPDVVVCEDQHGGVNQKTLMTLREVVGVIRVLTYDYGADFVMYAPSTIKKEIAGHGRASKKRVKENISKMLEIEEDIENDNITDALSVGATYFSLY